MRCNYIFCVLLSVYCSIKDQYCIMDRSRVLSRFFILKKVSMFINVCFDSSKFLLIFSDLKFWQFLNVLNFGLFSDL